MAGDVFDVGNVPFERSPEAAISCGAATGALVRSCKCKQTYIAEFRSTIRVAWSSPVKFSMSATCHLFEKRWRESVDNCRCRQSWSMSPPSPFRNFAENQQFFTFISPSILRSSISYFALYQHPSPDGPARRTSHGHLQP